MVMNNKFIACKIMHINNSAIESRKGSDSHALRDGTFFSEIAQKQHVQLERQGRISLP